MDAENCRQVFPWLWTSGQLSRDDMLTLPALGISAVINLAPPTSSNAVTGEAEIISGQGIVYLQIPVAWEAPLPDQFRHFVDALEMFTGKTVWVHCAKNMRVSAFVYLYRRIVLGEDDEAARFPMREIWEPNDIWRRFMADVLARRGAGAPDAD